MEYNEREYLEALKNGDMKKSHELLKKVNPNMTVQCRGVDNSSVDGTYIIERRLVNFLAIREDYKGVRILLENGALFDQNIDKDTSLMDYIITYGKEDNKDILKSVEIMVKGDAEVSNKALKWIARNGDDKLFDEALRSMILAEKPTLSEEASNRVLKDIKNRLEANKEARRTK